MLGRKIKILTDENYSEGEHQINFNASDLKSGIYFYTLQSEKFSETKSFHLVK